MSAREGNSAFCFPEGLNVSREKVEGNIETRGKTKLFPEETDIKCFVILYSDERNNNINTTIVFHAKKSKTIQCKRV